MQKVLKPIEKYWRIQGLRIAIFLDDGWAIVQDRESCRIKAKAVQRGFCCQRRKIGMGTRPSIGLVGYNLEFCTEYFKNYRKKTIVKIINSTIDHIIEADFKVSARELTSFTGQIISTGPVVGNIGRIMTRHCVFFHLVQR